ncbi:cobalamin-dependent protein [Calorimonas adulescens]|uniref:B12-binding domain-containing protein n=1 Tax=Calorimonas adulescens TaxID=2606906 RepID=A0A5D8QEB7_9THEO|nr:cobalamin-dependent protein [Calorimonas adulescens]TZE82519.1 hypothetical protein FWJ32_04365 [Calorimonas adulescens]
MLADAVHRYGAKASIELAGFAFGHEMPEGKSPIDMMSQEDINNWIKLFADAAERALKAGMDMVLLHGGHGILISNFFSPLFNHRTDKYGGSIENRARGKNIFKSMVEAGGFEVYDLRIDQSVENFVEKVKEVKPDIVGLSGVLTLAIDSMKDTIDGLKEAGLRDGVKIIISENPVTRESYEYVEADAFTTNAAEGVKICKGWVK